MNSLAKVLERPTASVGERASGPASVETIHRHRPLTSIIGRLFLAGAMPVAGTGLL
jgi:hypothetical protein